MPRLYFVIIIYNLPVTSTSFLFISRLIIAAEDMGRHRVTIVFEGRSEALSYSKLCVLDSRRKQILRVIEEARFHFAG